MHRVLPLLSLALAAAWLSACSSGSGPAVADPTADSVHDQTPETVAADAVSPTDSRGDVPSGDAADARQPDLLGDSKPNDASDLAADQAGDLAPDASLDLAGDALGEDQHADQEAVDQADQVWSDASSSDLADGLDAKDDSAGAGDGVDAVDAASDLQADASDLADVLTPLPADPVLNEVNCHGQDFVEIKNRSPESTADLTGYVLTDGEGPLHRYVFPAGTLIPPLGRIVVVEKTSLYAGFPFGIQCGSDTLRLLDPNEAVREELPLPLVMEGNTWSRLPDGDGPWQESSMTPFAENQLKVDLEGMLFNPFQVITIRLAMPQSSVDALWDDPRTFVAGTFSMQSEESVQEPIPVGIRIKGRYGSFQTLDHKSALKIKFNFADKELRFQGLKRLTLNNMVQDPSMIHEALAYRIFAGFGVPCPRVGYVQVYINDQLYGLYLVLEPYDDVTLSRHFVSTQHVYEGEYGEDIIPEEVADLEVDEGDPTDIYDLTNLAAMVSSEVPDEEWLGALETVADVPELLRMWAVEQYIGHWDGYSPTINNYYVHCDDDDVCSMLPSGTDQTFSDYRDIHSGNGYLFERCMSIQECRWWYDQTMGELMGVLDTLYLDAFAMELSQFLTPWVQSDSRKPYSNSDVVNYVQFARNFIIYRRENVGDALACLLDPNADEDGDGFTCDADCDEADPTVNVGAYDVCGDGIDQDCSGIADDSFECPDCREYWRGPHRYLVCPTYRTNQEAIVHCQELGAELVVLDCAGEEAWLRDALKAADVGDTWLGLTDWLTEGTFLRRDGSTPSYLDWAAGEPNDSGGEDCVEFYTWGQWNDISCEATNAVACEDVCTAGSMDADGDGALRCSDDCDDSNPAIHPGAVDVCGDGLDNDCDGMADNGLGCIPSVVLPVESAPGTFRFLPLATTREEARANCQALTTPSDLAWFDSKEQLNQVRSALTQMTGSNEAWIGVNDLVTEGTYVWADEGPLAFTNWALNQPNNGNGVQDCCRMLADGTWNDTDCTLSYPTLCRAL